MLQRIPSIPKMGVFLILLAGLFVSTPVDSFAKKKKASVKKVKARHHKKSRRSNASGFMRLTLGKQQALEMLRNDGSKELMSLAGMNDENPLNIDNSFRQLDGSNRELPQQGENLDELEKEDDVQVDIESFKSLWLSYIDPTGSNQTTEQLQCGIAKSAVMDAVMDWLGTPYHFGGTSRNGIDCSAFVRAVFNQSANIVLPRTAQSQSDIGRAVPRVSDLQFGDMVFFHTMNHAYVSHVGIYLGDNLFAHASSRYGVTISSLQSTYYGSRIIGARRLTISDLESLSPKQEFVTDTR